ncbi:MAG: nucleoside deaminase [Alphaproteobacteria bacterium TMED93]|nr:MAG: nucleoside deaminase [Alphaproteobacteria bacterium TMED93]
MLQLSQITKIALIQARKAFAKREVPVGAVIFNKDRIISKAYNMIICKNDPIGHAEIIALKRATKKLKTTNLMNYSLYVTLEPCMICSYIIAKFKVGYLYFGAYDIRNGSIHNGTQVFLNEKNIHIPEVFGGIGEKESKELLDEFFKKIRK